MIKDLVENMASVNEELGILSETLKIFKRIKLLKGILEI